jgi:isocitrate lyase
MIKRIREVVPNTKLVYNNSPLFIWILNFCQQTFDTMQETDQDISAYDRKDLWDVKYDDTELVKTADERIRAFQANSSRESGILHHLVT